MTNCVQGRVIVSVRNRVTLPQELLAEIERVAGKGGIDEFIVEAIERALRQRRQLIASEAAGQAAYPGVGRRRQMDPRRATGQTRRMG